jgi:hypothetical protein
MNKDLVYLISFILIIINTIIVNKKQIPLYTKTILFRLVFMICLVVVLNYNIFIGFFVALSYLLINNK